MSIPKLTAAQRKLLLAMYSECSMFDRVHASQLGHRTATLRALEALGLAVCEHPSQEGYLTTPGHRAAKALVTT
jgi:hypothetical protein